MIIIMILSGWSVGGGAEEARPTDHCHITNTYIYIYITNTYIYIYREREKEMYRDRER